MKTKNVIVQCDYGLHLRVASKVVAIAKQSGASVHIQCEGCPKADACSIIQLLMLEATEGTPLKIEVESSEENEKAVLQALTAVFEEGGGI
jgi:phosphotransferase system HPr (HPr) family protein